MLPYHQSIRIIGKGGKNRAKMAAATAEGCASGSFVPCSFKLFLEGRRSRTTEGSDNIQNRTRLQQEVGVSLPPPPPYQIPPQSKKRIDIGRYATEEILVS